ncbi:MAG: DNA helicase PcrA [Lachnospiraceae bacterium]|nr:DNA helicase PcrA [Lachnospiraceae bacterium]
MLLDTLNERQREAVLSTEGPLLILAGAGSGKTRVITHRIAYLIEEQGVNPWNIMAITFTNKAAGEMRERVDDLVGFGSESIWVATFHSSCVKILRRYIDRIGYDNNFTIYDTDDQKTVVKDICKRLNIDTKTLKERAVLSAISSAKNELVSPEKYLKECGDNYGKSRIGHVYREYQAQLKKNNALDFDDLLVKAVELFETCPDVLEYYQERFKYIMIDEYQDTNTVQFKFVSLLASKYKNLCVVGDDDQSIYKFRGANIANILNFEKVFPDTKVIKLEQNYRSKGNILKAANSVISHNTTRKDKALWTEKDDGDKIALREYNTAYEEAEAIADDIKKNAEDGVYAYRQCACLYRTNAQSRTLEEKLISRNIPYKLFGGVNFYQRKEVKDILAYLKTVDNARDDVAVKRIINIPKRGIGQTTLDKVQSFADSEEISFFDALKRVDEMDIAARTKNKIHEFVNSIRVYRSKLGDFPLTEVFDDIIDGTGYIEELKNENTEEAMGRIENVEELFSKLADYQAGAEEPTLSGFLEEVALVADIDSYEGNSDYVVLMTIHSSKGLEFPKVYLCGMEDGLFPSYMSITDDDPTEVEEERRLCYVAITRAMESLTMTYAKSRMVRGEIQYGKVSRFVKEIPMSLMERGDYPAANFARTKPVGSFGGFGKKAMSASDLLQSGLVKKGFSSVTSYAQPEKTQASQNLGGAYGLGYDVGDQVKHIKFGVGNVVSIVNAGRDYEVTVQFENYGVKKLFAQFAKLKKV